MALTNISMDGSACRRSQPPLPVLWVMLGCLVAASSARATTPYPGGVWEPGPAMYGATIQDGIAVTMDDGVVLHANISYPTDRATGRRAAGQFPVVIENTPYTTVGRPIGRKAYLTEHGYIYITIRPRGTIDSGGDVQFFSSRDGLDGKAIVDWAAHRLEGSDGRIALLGCSYPAGTALVTAAAVGRNSPVKAAIAACDALGSGQVREMWMTNGVPNPGIGYPAIAPSTMGNSPAALKFFSTTAAEIGAGGDAAYDREFWRARVPIALAKNIVENEVPILLWSGWKDIAPGAAIRTYVALQNASVGRPLDPPMLPHQRTTPRYQLVMGDWPHETALDSGIYLEWLETWVKGIDTGIKKTLTPLHVFETGTQRWINLAQYPSGADTTSWYLQSDSLQPSAAKINGSVSLSWGDPDQPGSRLSFITLPLIKGTTLSGPISAALYARSSNTNLLLIAKLYDIAPDGSAAEITKGVLLGSLRALDSDASWTDGKEKVVWPWPTLKGDEFLRPGQVYRFELTLTPHQHGLAPGHRLRLDLTSQSPGDVCPVSAPPNGPSEVCRLTAPQQATVPGGRYEILYGPKYPSALNLPQLPWLAFPTAAAGILPTAESNKFTVPADWGPTR